MAHRGPPVFDPVPSAQSFSAIAIVTSDDSRSAVDARRCISTVASGAGRRRTVGRAFTFVTVAVCRVAHISYNTSVASRSKSRCLPTQ